MRGRGHDGRAIRRSVTVARMAVLGCSGGFDFDMEMQLTG
jgi:hypothetical protein